MIQKCFYKLREAKFNAAGGQPNLGRPPGTDPNVQLIENDARSLETLRIGIFLQMRAIANALE